MEYAQLTPGPGFSLGQSLLYYSQRIITSLALRRIVVAALRRSVLVRQGIFPADHIETAEDMKTLETLSNDGYAPLPSLLDAEQLADIHAFFRSKRLTPRPGIGRQFTIDDVPDGIRMANYDLKDIIDAPHILELANSPSLLHLAANYIGCKPTISALGLRWSFPSAGAATDVQAFHRDMEDWRYLKVLVYLTDVDEEAGPNFYIGG